MRGQRAIQVTDEHEVAGGRQHATEVWIFKLQPDLGFAGHRIEPFEAAVKPLGPQWTAASEALPRLPRSALVDEVLLLYRLNDVASLDRWNIEQVELGVIGAGLPVLSA